METESHERDALLVNDIRVLASQLNERIEQAARRGLSVEVEAPSVLKMSGGVCCCPVVAVRVLAEVS